MAFADELASGILPASTPELRAAYGLTAGHAAGWLLAAFQVVSIFLEPTFLLLAARGRRAAFLCGGLLVSGLACLLGASSTAWWMLVLALLLDGASCGCGVHLSQTALVDAHPRERERVLTRWMLFGQVGDAAAFVLLPLSLWARCGWRGALAVCGAIWVVLAALLWRERPLSVQRTNEETPMPLRSLAREVLENRRLRVWLAGVFLCTLLDEILIAFGALHLQSRLGMGPAMRSLVFGSLLTGGAVGTLVAERLLATMPPLLLLRYATVAGTIAYVAWVFSPGAVTSVTLAFVAGALIAPYYPIAQSQVYASLPGHSAEVSAAASLLQPLELILPLALGALADGAGLTAVMLVLAIEPVGLFLLSWL